jgi:hypothetical protein
VFRTQNHVSPEQHLQRKPQVTYQENLLRPRLTG